MVIKKKSEVSKGAGAGAGSAPEEEAEALESGAKPGTKTKVNVKAKAEATPDVECVALFESYDENVAAVEKSFIALVEHIQEKQLDKATVVASMMKARGITYESAMTQYSTMRKIFNNEEVLEELKAGKITMKVARAKTKTAQKNPAAAKPEAKEQKFNATLKSFVAAAKESGFTRREILVTVEAELKSAEIK